MGTSLPLLMAQEKQLTVFCLKVRDTQLHALANTQVAKIYLYDDYIAVRSKEFQLVQTAYRVAHQLSDTITRTQPFLSDQTELAILATFSTSEGVTQQACTVPASAEG